MNVAVLGAGNMGKTVIRHLLDDENISAIYVYDIDQARANDAGDTRKVRSRSLEDIMADAEIPLVYITASNDVHFPLAMESLKAGKAVMCEKPMANSLEDCRTMLAYARKRELFLQIGFELRYSRLYLTAKRWIDDGLLGKVLGINCIYVCSESREKDSWRNKCATGGSMFGEKLSHYSDLCRWFTGDEAEEVYSACAPNAVPYFEVHDNYQTTIRFAGGSVAHITFMMNLAAAFEGDPLQDILAQQKDDGHELRYLIVGEKGAIETDVFRRRIKRWEFRDTPKKMHSAWVEDLSWDAKEDHFYVHNTTDQTRDIARRVARKLGPYTPARDSFETMRICEAAERSAENRSVVKLVEIAGE